MPSLPSKSKGHLLHPTISFPPQKHVIMEQVGHGASSALGIKLKHLQVGSQTPELLHSPALLLVGSYINGFKLYDYLCIIIMQLIFPSTLDPLRPPSWSLSFRPQTNTLVLMVAADSIPEDFLRARLMAHDQLAYSQSMILCDQTLCIMVNVV